MGAKQTAGPGRMLVLIINYTVVDRECAPKIIIE